MRDAENSYLTGGAEDDEPMNQLLGSSITYRIAVGSQQGRNGAILGANQQSRMILVVLASFDLIVVATFIYNCDFELKDAH